MTDNLSEYDWDKLVAWMRDPVRKPANTAFTAGAARDAATAFESAMHVGWSEPSNVSSKVEEVARSIARGHAEIFSGVISEQRRMNEAQATEDFVQDCWRQFVAGAKHTIKALRNPTTDMKLQGARSIGRTMGQENHNVRSDDCWKAMVDAALEGE